MYGKGWGSYGEGWDDKGGYEDCTNVDTGEFLPGIDLSMFDFSKLSASFGVPQAPVPEQASDVVVPVEGERRVDVPLGETFSISDSLDLGSLAGLFGSTSSSSFSGFEDEIAVDGGEQRATPLSGLEAFIDEAHRTIITGWEGLDSSSSGLHDSDSDSFDSSSSGSYFIGDFDDLADLELADLLRDVSAVVFDGSLDRIEEEIEVPRSYVTRAARMRVLPGVSVNDALDMLG